MVGHMTLDHDIGVRIPGGQPSLVAIECTVETTPGAKLVAPGVF